ncbi:hypothetical protein [Candidatus Methylacidithermus pantelleriae]|uniref:Uncharacterized protein n=1 Tax=Candidatus Methylacidithermus pantelleriae TaxID=2744239 RepID=A0A8J2BWL9_9BACT|nr:hypothetical protein [Candidatus Methylacidithermus pantelleriae]CAF0705026.1 hypothetical protein MPNT_80073 [Candidatus Methylacidithermus pantelleriae]
MLASAEAQPIFLVTRLPARGVSIDTNEDYLALAETDRFCNLVDLRRIGWNLHGKRGERAKAIFTDGCKEIVRACAESGELLLIERLNLRKRELKLESADPVGVGSLSLPTPRRSRCSSRHLAVGVEVIEVDPAYTSTIGAVNQARRHGMGFHHRAASCPRSERDGSLPTPVGARGSRAYAQWQWWPLSPYSQAIGRRMDGRFYGGSSAETQSSVARDGRRWVACCVSVLEKAGLGATWGSASGMAAGESAAALFGRRAERASQVEVGSQWFGERLGTRTIRGNPTKPVSFFPKRCDR